MMSGKASVGYRLAECGWVIDVADARKVKAVAPRPGATLDDVRAAAWAFERMGSDPDGAMNTLRGLAGCGTRRFHLCDRAPNVRRTCSSVEASTSCVTSRLASPCSQRRVAARLRPVQHSSA